MIGHTPAWAALSCHLGIRLFLPFTYWELSWGPRRRTFSLGTCLTAGNTSDSVVGVFALGCRLRLQKATSVDLMDTDRQAQFKEAGNDMTVLRFPLTLFVF